jgi:Ca2+-binding EF-hand superfamily protein
MQLSDLQAALREHEARTLDALAARQAESFSEALEHFFALSPKTPNGRAQGSNLMNEISSERAFWTEAVLHKVEQVVRPLEEAVRANDAGVRRLQGSIEEIGSSVAEVRRQKASVEEKQQQTQSEARLEARLERDLGERRKYEATLQGQLDQQSATLQGLEAGLAELRELLHPPATEEFQASGEFQAEQGPDGSEPLAETSSSHKVTNSRLHGSMMEDSRTIAQTPTLTADEDDSVPNAVRLTKILGNKLQRRAQRLISRRRFVVATSAVIFASCITIGLEVNETMRDPAARGHLGFRVTNLFFIVVFVSELALRWVAEGCFFLSPKNLDFTWNAFDVLLVALSIFEEFLWAFSIKFMTFLFLRLARLLRLMRMLRAFKFIRELKELRIMVGGLMNCVKPLFWASVLIVSLTYMSAILICQILQEHSEDIEESGQKQAGPGTVNLQAFVEDNFPNLPWAMYTILEALLGGKDWGDIAHPFMEINYVLLFVLVGYILVGVFCLLNLVTAVFLEAATRIDDVRELVYAKKDWMATVHEFFTRSIDELEEKEDGLDEQRGRLTKDKFSYLMAQKETVKFLEENGVDLCFEHNSRYEELFDLMDEDVSGAIDVHEFIASLYHLKGAARALDVQLEHQRTVKMLAELQDIVGRIPQTRLSRSSSRGNVSARGSIRKSASTVSRAMAAAEYMERDVSD